MRSLSEVGLEDVQLVANFDCLKGTSKENIGRKFGVRGVNVSARKPAADHG